MTTYAEIILPLPLSQTFTYSVPKEWASEIQIGCRVTVSFGRKKIYTGIVQRIHSIQPEGFDVKPITALLDTKPILKALQLKLWDWMAYYYLSSLGEIMKAALPSGLKPEGDSEKGILQSYHPRTETMLSLPPLMVEEEQTLQKAIDSLKRAPKQQELLLLFLDLCHYEPISTQNKEKQEKTISSTNIPINRHSFLTQAGTSANILSQLIKRGFLEQYEVERGRLCTQETKKQAIKPLNAAQKEALRQIQQFFSKKNAPKGSSDQAQESKQICLLHGVTSSGKTEIYIHLIEEVLKRKKQVLYLLPEIALTTQITERLKCVFGNQIGIYHSQFSDEIRIEIWQKQLSENPYPVILGARSSLFLPWKDLDLIIVDEEHENSFKQYDPSPRYHAKHTAMVLASYFKAKVLLGSATPSIESYQLAKEGKYGLVLLSERYQGLQLPSIIPIDIKELRHQKKMNGSFSQVLLDAIKKALSQKEQIILFQNRRGFSPLIECKSCGWIPRCKNCDVSLTYHKKANLLTCHYCGYTENVPTQCPSCEKSKLAYHGIGTERIEDEISILFPEAKIARMDIDTAHTRIQYEQILSNLECQNIDILIGTQMISKGLDFDHVSTVGILDADTMLNFPDFRAHERAFQLIAQVAGRAGRKGKRGAVYIQTRSIEHPIIRQVMQYDYEALYKDQLEERALFHYPPYYRLIYVYLKHRNKSIAEKAAMHISGLLRTYLPGRVMGPVEPIVARVQQLFIRQIVLKMEHEASVNQTRQLLHYAQQELLSQPLYKSVIIYYDVDPM
ncbi:MAG: primosomal protein N' [Bacteroidaceae bacterium]